MHYPLHIFAGAGVGQTQLYDTARDVIVQLSILVEKQEFPSTSAGVMRNILQSSDSRTFRGL